MVVARPIELQSGRTDTITNPLLIAEVLSKGTKAYDRDEKFAAYRSIPSFQEYLLIDQYWLQVEQYSKTEANKWIFSEYSCMRDRLTLRSVTVEISLADLYQNIEFSEELPMPGLFEVNRPVNLGLASEEILLLDECSVEGEWEGQVRFLPLR